MLEQIEAHRSDIADLCRRYHVRRMEVFGSAARSTEFDPERSDIDLLVAFDPARPPTLADYFDLRDRLATLFGRPVDLVMSGAVRKPFFQAGIERSKEPLYAA